MSSPLRTRVVRQIDSLKSDLSSDFSTVAALFKVRMLQKQSGDEGIAQRGWMSADAKPPPPLVTSASKTLVTLMSLMQRKIKLPKGAD